MTVSHPYHGQTSAPASCGCAVVRGDAGARPTASTAPDAVYREFVPTCVGCGAMNRLGTCASGCAEHRLDLVPASAYDGLASLEQAAQARLAVLARALSALLDERPPSVVSQDAYRSAQTRARDALRSTDGACALNAVEAAAAAATWTCRNCGGVDAPQPCLGICIWREIEWVDGEAYEHRRARVAAILEQERRVRGLLGRLAYATPRDGHWELSWAALQAAAGELWHTVAVVG